MRLVIAGAIGGSNVGDSFHRAAKDLGCDSTIVDTRLASKGSRLWRSIHWHLLDHRPCNLTAYNRLLQSELNLRKPDLLLTTGVAPVTGETLRCAQQIKTSTVNFSTDDPWNPTQRSQRFLQTIPLYNKVFTPRRSNLRDFVDAGATSVEFLPFGYDPTLSYRLDVPKSNEFDVLFVGGGDHDRVQILRFLVSHSIKIRIAGDYWPDDLKPLVAGHLSPDEICRLTCEAKVCLVLPRKANRDGHAMRSYEVAAIGCAAIAEDTQDHRELYGDTAIYFRELPDLLTKVQDLLHDRTNQQALEASMRSRMAQRDETYSSRLKTILRHL